MSEALRHRILADGTRRLQVGRTVWLGRQEMLDAAGRAEVARVWRTCRTPSTVRVGRWTYRQAWVDNDTLGRVLEGLLLHGLSPYVSSWGGVWRRFAPRVSAPRPAVRRVLERGTWPYAWEELGREPGPLPEDWATWDLCSAYPWASSLGLPLASTLEVVEGRRAAWPDDQAVHLVDEVDHDLPEAPVLPPWLRPRPRSPQAVDSLWMTSRWRPAPRGRWVSGELLNRLALVPKSARQAVRWHDTLKVEDRFDWVRQVYPDPLVHKFVLASHWGSWVARRGCLDERWERGVVVRSRRIPALPNRLDAGVVQARVHTRLSQNADGAARIFVDSVTLPPGRVPHPLGDSPGQWRVKQERVREIRPLPWRPRVL